MKILKFIVVGENIHCTRILKRDGAFVARAGDGTSAILYEAGGSKRMLPIPDVFIKSADWENGKIKRCAVAVWQGMYGDDKGRDAGADYIRSLVLEQERAGAAFIDVNVDEFSMELDERVKAMEWTAALAQEAGALPLSIDSANEDVMRAGIRACDRSRGRPLINSVSLERPAMAELASEYEAAVVVSASGESALPAAIEDRMANFRAIVPRLEGSGIRPGWMYFDPLVYTISTEPRNGRIFLDSVAAVREEYGPDIHIIGGLSNVSFGMPCRRLINQVFARLCVERGGDGGIVDPLQINAAILERLDMESEAFKLARALLVGEDEFGMEFISAHRDGRLA